mmetsp:Transcript_90030/g.263182  ORF Transcript_90030/g.263182 Transcript_90030/m.263182 type:complete len:517 (+) Transcript_90030:62-1612(+)
MFTRGHGLPPWHILLLALAELGQCCGSDASEPKLQNSARALKLRDDKVCLMQRSLHVNSRAYGTSEVRGTAGAVGMAAEEHVSTREGRTAQINISRPIALAAAAEFGRLNDTSLQGVHYTRGLHNMTKSATSLLGRWSGFSHSSIACPLTFVILALASASVIISASFSGDSHSFLDSVGEPDIRKVFQMIDTDNSGTLSLEEVRQFIKSGGRAIPDNQIEAIVRMADTDDSGDLDCEEFSLLLRSLGDEAPRDTRRCLIAEFVGMFMFQFFGGMPDTGGIGNALIVVALIFSFAPISGAHFNPAVTVAAWMSRQVTQRKAMYYILVNMLAAIEAVLLMQWIGIDQISSVSGVVANPCTAPSPELPAWHILVLETLSTFTFIIVFLAVAVDPKSGWGNAGPIALGITLIGLNLACAHLTGLSMNPARFLAPCIVYGCFPSFWETVCYIAAALCGSVFAALLYLAVFFDRPTPEQRFGMSNFTFMITDNSHLKRMLAQKRLSTPNRSREPTPRTKIPQ